MEQLIYMLKIEKSGTQLAWDQMPVSFICKINLEKWAYFKEQFFAQLLTSTNACFCLWML
jgi:hypothetical protein